MWWDGSRSQCLLPSVPEPHFWWSLYPALYFLRTRAYHILPHVQVQERDDSASGNNTAAHKKLNWQPQDSCFEFVGSHQLGVAVTHYNKHT